MYQNSEVLHLDKIKIYNYERTQFIEMPKVKDIDVGAKEVANTITMASGKVVKDILGYRPSITAKWDYVPASTIVSLLSLLRANHFLYVMYPSPSGDAAGVFEIDYPTLTVFQYKNGTAVWHDVTLKMSGQEVV